MKSGFQASPAMAMTGSQFLEEGPEVASVAAIDLNPGRLSLMFGQPRYKDLFLRSVWSRFRLRGPGVTQLQEVFAEDWQFTNL
jgi:hypothetical protein